MRIADVPTYRLAVQDLGFERPHLVRVMIGQMRSCLADWSRHDGLYFHKDVAKTASVICQFLRHAETWKVGLIVLPELGVPRQCIDLLRTWSSQTGAVVVGGTHYAHYADGYRNECPVIVAGQRYTTGKFHPAHMELSPTPSKSVRATEEIKIFTNTPAGNFGVLICADYLNGLLTEKVIASVEEGLDLLCVPAFQRDSNRYHPQMALDCQNSEHGLYIAYANMLCGNNGDGHSALFGNLDRQYLDKLNEEKLRSGGPNERIFDFGEAYDYGIFELDLKHKRPYQAHTYRSHLNISIVRVDTLSDELTPSPVLDINSLKQFVSTSPAISRIDVAIRDAIGKTIVSADEFIATFVARLAYVGITTTDDLERALSTNEAIVTRAAIGWFNHPRGRATPLIPSGIGISFLCVAVIMRGANPLTNLREFWRQNAFNPKADINEITAVTAEVYSAALS
jgi:predicted amidohydrolase